MTNRRNFLLQSLAITATGLAACEPKKGWGQTPISIATWGPNTTAVEAAMAAIKAGKTALDAVEAGAMVPESNPDDQSVGYGGRPDRDGKVTLDACIMDWEMNTGSVTFLEGFKHPVSIARRVMEKTPHVMLSGDGARQFALEEGFQEENLLTDKSEAEYKEWLKEAKYAPVANIERHDTIGILAIDNDKHIAGACTTSGMAYKMHGRVGDSPIPGAGMYVDDEIGGAVATGVGELVMKTCGSFLIVELMRQGLSPQRACEEAVIRISKKIKNTTDFQVGFLAVNKEGVTGAYSLLKGFSYVINYGEETKVVESDYLTRS